MHRELSEFSNRIPAEVSRILGIAVEYNYFMLVHSAALLFKKAAEHHPAACRHDDRCLFRHFFCCFFCFFGNILELYSEVLQDLSCLCACRAVAELLALRLQLLGVLFDLLCSLFADVGSYLRIAEMLDRFVDCGDAFLELCDQLALGDLVDGRSSLALELVDLRGCLLL